MQRDGRRPDASGSGCLHRAEEVPATTRLSGSQPLRLLGFLGALHERVDIGGRAHAVLSAAREVLTGWLPRLSENAAQVHWLDSTRSVLISGSANATWQALWTQGNIEACLLRTGTDFEWLLASTPGVPSVEVVPPVERTLCDKYVQRQAQLR